VVRGSKKTSSKGDESPGIFVNSSTGAVTVLMLVEKQKTYSFLTSKSIGKIRPGVWTQLTIRIDRKSLRIYLNGVFDGIVHLKSN
jgi:hypothetical protein